MRRFGNPVIKRSVILGVLLLCLGAGLWGCGDRPTATVVKSSRSPLTQSRRIVEVAPPEIFQELRQTLDSYQPQVEILSPRPGVVLDDDRVTVQFQVRDLPIFKDEDLGLGPYLQVYLDDQPYQAVYDANQTLIFQGLMPGTHTVRAIAARPWHETYKNEGAFASVTFHIFTKTPKNNPDPARPLITYSRPQSTVGAEPVMLDFYLTNVPLHLIAQERSDDDIKDWRIKCTVNGESFIFDEWRPIYLKGLKPGKNWVQLELLDEDGLPTENAFNNTVRLIVYEPGGKDTLSRLIRDEIPASEALAITDPNYVPELPAPEPVPFEEPFPEPSPESLEEEPQAIPEEPPAIAPESPAETDLPPIEELTPEPETPPESEINSISEPEDDEAEDSAPDSFSDAQPEQKSEDDNTEPGPEATPFEATEPDAPEEEPSEPEIIQPFPAPVPDLPNSKVEPLPPVESPEPPEAQPLPDEEFIPEDLEPTQPSTPDVIPDLPIEPLPGETRVKQTPVQRFQQRFQGLRDRLSDNLKQRQEKGRSFSPDPQESTTPSPPAEPELTPPIPFQNLEPTREPTPDLPLESPYESEPELSPTPELAPSTFPSPTPLPPIGGTPWV